MTEARASAAGPPLLAVGGVALVLLAAAFLAGSGQNAASGMGVVLLGAVGIAALSYLLLGKGLRLVPLLIDLVVLGAFVAGRDPNAKLWSVPGTWLDALRLTPEGAAVMVLLYGASATVAAVRLHRRLAARESLAILLLPVMFNLMLTLGSDGLTRGLGRAFLFGAPVPDWIAGAVGRAAILMVFVEVHAAALRILVAGALTADRRLHAVLLVAPSMPP